MMGTLVNNLIKGMYNLKGTMHIQHQCLLTEYIYPYSVGMRENAEKNNSEYGHFSRSVI